MDDRTEARGGGGGRMQEQLLVVQGTVAQRPTVGKTIRAFRGNQGRTGWFISSAPVALEADMKTEEGEGGGFVGGGG